MLNFDNSFLCNTTASHNVALGESKTCKSYDFMILGHMCDLLIMDLHHQMHKSIISKYIENDFLKAGIMISNKTEC